MSVIKFRAYVPETGKYYYSKDFMPPDFRIWADDDGILKLFLHTESGLEIVDTAIIQLWSGICDKDGNELYEGDSVTIGSIPFKRIICFGEFDSCEYYSIKTKGFYIEYNGDCISLHDNDTNIISLCKDQI